MSYIVLVNIHTYHTKTSLMQEILFYSMLCCQQKCFKVYCLQHFKPKITKCVIAATESWKLGGISTPMLFSSNKAEECALFCAD